MYLTLGTGIEGKKNKKRPLKTKWRFATKKSYFCNPSIFLDFGRRSK